MGKFGGREMRIQEKLYFALPVQLQNIAASVYGLKLKRQRYGRFYKKAYRQLMVSQYWNGSQYDEYQGAQLEDLLKYARANVPYYRDLFRKHDVNDLNDFKKIPILDKETLRQNYSGLMDCNLKKYGFAYTNTSGTTGTPIRVPVYHEGRQKNYAFFERAKRWAGIPENSRGVTFAGRVLVRPNAVKGPYWRYNYFNNNLQCSSYHLSEQNLLEYYKAIRDFKADFLDSYPSTAYILAKFIRERRLPRVSFCAVITSAETLLDYQRRTIEEVFGCSVFDQYGNAEQAGFICQCEAGSYHVNLEYGIMEFLNPVTQEEAKHGELAEVVCTGFTNKAMPLIRYGIGDTAIASSEMCPCGRKFPVVDRLTGRVDDLIITKDGRKIGRLDPVFKGVGETIVESQIIQTDYGHLVLKIVRGSDYSESDGLKVVEEIHKRTGYSFKVDIKYVEAIPREANGKLKSVISHVPQQIRCFF